MDEDFKRKVKAVRCLTAELDAMESQIGRLEGFLDYQGDIHFSVECCAYESDGIRTFGDVLSVVPAGAVGSLVRSFAVRRRDELRARYGELVEMVYGALKEGYDGEG